MAIVIIYCVLDCLLLRFWRRGTASIVWRGRYENISFDLVTPQSLRSHRSQLPDSAFEGDTDEEEKEDKIVIRWNLPDKFLEVAASEPPSGCLCRTLFSSSDDQFLEDVAGEPSGATDIDIELDEETTDLGQFVEIGVGEEGQLVLRPGSAPQVASERDRIGPIVWDQDERLWEPARKGLHPMYCQGDSIEYYSKDYSCWILGEVVGIRQDPLQHQGEIVLRYDVTLKLKNGFARLDAKPEVLRPALFGGESCSFFDERDGAWKEGVIADRQFSNPTIFGYKVHPVAVVGTLSPAEAIVVHSNLLRRHYRVGADVKVYYGCDKGWATAKVLGPPEEKEDLRERAAELREAMEETDRIADALRRELVEAQQNKNGWCALGEIRVTERELKYRHEEEAADREKLSKDAARLAPYAHLQVRSVQSEETKSFPLYLLKSKLDCAL